MTWAKLAAMISKLSPLEQNTNIAIFVNDEVYSGVDANFLINLNELDQIDYGHPYLEITTKCQSLM
jgi:hypothetical protein